MSNSMMQNTRLLERIRLMDKSTHWEGEDSTEIVRESIMAHLTQILNTRQGSTLIAQDFGIPDFSHLITTSFEAKDIERMEQGLAKVIGRYEKRLKNIKIVYRPSPEYTFAMPFELQADLVGSTEKDPIHFHTVFSSQGRVNIEQFNPY